MHQIVSWVFINESRWNRLNASFLKLNGNSQYYQTNDPKVYFTKFSELIHGKINRWVKGRDLAHGNERDEEAVGGKRWRGIKPWWVNVCERTLSFYFGF